MILGFTWNKEEQGAGADVKSGLANTTEENSAIAGIQTEPQSATKMLMTTKLVWFIHPTPTTELENPQDSILPAIATALATTTQLR